MGDRPRIKKELVGEVVVDESAYITNKSSNNVKKILTQSEHIEIDIFFDKHYYNRAQMGDEKGKREGIEEESIIQLVIKTLPHLIYYSFKVSNFTFVNFKKDTRYVRIVLQESVKSDMLNIVTEFHYNNRNKYEVTVITAMKDNDFKISQGQSVIEIDGSNSHLRKYINNKFVDIDNYII